MSLDFAGRPHKVNRILKGFQSYQERIDITKANGVGANGKPVDWDALEKTANITDEEAFQFQNIQSRGFAMGLLSEEEASLLYQKLGRENPNAKRFNALPLNEKMAINKTMAEILEFIHKKQGNSI